jgi:hypothetical protein
MGTRDFTLFTDGNREFESPSKPSGFCVSAPLMLRIASIVTHPRLTHSLIFFFWNNPTSGPMSACVNGEGGKPATLTRHFRHPRISRNGEEFSLGSQRGRLVKRPVKDIDEISGIGLTIEPRSEADKISPRKAQHEIHNKGQTIAAEATGNCIKNLHHTLESARHTSHKTRDAAASHLHYPPRARSRPRGPR